MSANSETMKFSLQPFYKLLVDQLKQQGLSFLLIAGLAYMYFGKAESCNKKLIEMYQENNTKMMKIIEANNKVIELNSQILMNPKIGS